MLHSSCWWYLEGAGVNGDFTQTSRTPGVGVYNYLDRADVSGDLRETCYTPRVGGI